MFFQKNEKDYVNLLTAGATSHRHIFTHAGMAELVDAADSKSAGFTAVGVQVSLSVPCAFSRGYVLSLRRIVIPFFAFYGMTSPVTPPLLVSLPSFLSLFSLSSIPKKDAALAASLPHAANARSKGGVRAASTTPPVPPLSPLQDLAERSKGQELAPSHRSKPHRFFPDPQLIGVVWGALRLRMRCLEKTENLKIVQFAPTLLSAAIFNSVLPAAILNSELTASILNLVQTAALSNSAVCTPAQKIVSRNFIAAPKTSLKKNLPEPYAVSLNWQCAPLSSDHILEVAA